jgi:PKD repeat protein
MKENSILSRKTFKVFIFAVLALIVSAILNGQFNTNTASAALGGSDVDTEAECRWCHCGNPVYLPDQHHLKVDQPVPGSTTGETYNCFGQCHSMTQVQTPTPHLEFIPFRNCIQCHTADPNPGHHGRTDYTCTDCHEMRWVGAPMNAIVTVLMNWCGGTPHPAYDPPTAVAGPDQEVLVGQAVNLDGSNSYDTELTGYKLSYEWDFGDGSPHVWGRRQSHTYTKSGTYEAKLKVYNYACSTDTCTIGRCGVPCLTGSDSVVVKVRTDLTNNTLPTASAGPDIVASPVNQVVFDLTGTRDPDGSIEYMYLEFGDGQRIDSPPLNVTHIYNSIGNYTARLTVYDDDGATATDTVNVSIVNVAVSVPSNLTAPTVEANRVVLNWSYTQGANQATGMRIERATGAGAYTQLASIGVLTSYTDTTALQATTYKYRVIAFNTTGDSSPSNILTVTTPAAVTPPKAPGNLRASKSGTTVTLTWKDNSNNEQGFYVEHSTDSGKTWQQVGQTAANVTTFKNTGTTGKTYYYRVRAYNSGGNSAYSSSVSIRL